jgi:hypothetical protein
MLWKTLKALYPRKYSDPEWGSWAGAYMGIYMGNMGKIGKISVGDKIVPTRTSPWDAHLSSEISMKIYVYIFAMGIMSSIFLANKFYG